MPEFVKRMSFFRDFCIRYRLVRYRRVYIALVQFIYCVEPVSWPAERIGRGSQLTSSPRMIYELVEKLIARCYDAFHKFKEKLFSLAFKTHRPLLRKRTLPRESRNRMLSFPRSKRKVYKKIPGEQLRRRNRAARRA